MLMFMSYVMYNVIICGVADYISSIIHELAHCCTYILFIRRKSYCYVRHPWFMIGKGYIIPYKILLFKKLEIILSEKGPCSVFIVENSLDEIKNKLYFIVVLLAGPIFELLFLYYIKIITSVDLLDIVLIVNFIANIYPCVVLQYNETPYNNSNMNDGLRLINLFYPQFRGLKYSIELTIISVVIYIIYRVTC